jgi:predicted transcriptional regulator
MQVDVLPVMSITTDTEAQILRELPTRCVNISQVIYNFNLNYGYLNYINRK